MTVYRRCVRCTKREGCEIKARLSEALRGLGITSVLHKCDEFEPPFAPGQPIIARMTVDGEPDPYGERDEPLNADYAGWFVQETQADRKALIYIRPGQLPLTGNKDQAFEAKSHGFCKVAWWRVMPDIPAGVSHGPCPVCARCGQIMGHGDCVLYGSDATKADCAPMGQAA